MKKILVPIPSYGFDPTEVAIPWKILTRDHCELLFATPTGTQASADEIMLTGKRLGIWRNILKARKDAVDAYRELEQYDNFRNPLKYTQIRYSDHDALLLPGGHDKGVKEYLESEILQRVVVDFFESGKPVAAICHGVLLAARSTSPQTGKSVLYGYKTTALLKKQEMLAYNMTRWWLHDYYLTYPGMTVEDEVKSALSSPDNFITAPTGASRDSENNLERGFVARDRNYLSARWPGDAYRFSFEFSKMLMD